MGAWGTGLFSDDVACEVKEYYMNCLREEMTAAEAVASVYEYFQCELADEDDGPVVVLALADTAWRTGRLSDNLKNAAIRIIDNGEDLERWEAEGASLLKKRRNVLLKLKDRLLSPQPPEKKVSKYRLYKCQWEIGDVFAYRFESEIAKEKGYFGKYMLIQKIGEGGWYPGHIVPIVYFRITKDQSLPSIENVNDLRWVKIAKRDEYRGKLLNTSKRIIPKSLIYLGNTNVASPDPEYIPKHDVSYFNVDWKTIDEWIIERYEKFNLDL
ncbi:MAG: DUF4259 domain-containing protein [Clostridium sp.]|nr:DUF4259 domain-containing protein [Clostridium sp.]MCM1546746.1 DUF4259 domain-containing protein [Ruminococcus sp.]